MGMPVRKLSRLDFAMFTTTSGSGRATGSGVCVCLCIGTRDSKFQRDDFRPNGL